MLAVNVEVAKGTDWKEIGRLIKEEKKKQNPVALMIHSLDLQVENHRCSQCPCCCFWLTVPACALCGVQHNKITITLNDDMTKITHPRTLAFLVPCLLACRRLPHWTIGTRAQTCRRDCRWRTTMRRMRCVPCDSVVLQGSDLAVFDVLACCSGASGPRRVGSVNDGAPQRATLLHPKEEVSQLPRSAACLAVCSLASLSRVTQDRAQAAEDHRGLRQGSQG